MTRVEAIHNLIREARAEGGSNTAAKRTVRSLRALDLTQGEIVEVMSILDYCNDEGTPYNAKIERSWELCSETK